MVCFKDGVPEKSNYRRYRIRTVAGQDDFASMAEVVRRRYSRILLETKEVAPDLSEFNQEPVEDAVNRAQSLDKLETSPLDKLETSPPDKLETSPLDKRTSGSSPLPHHGSERLVRLPDLIIVDGGKGQLSAACRELQRLGLSERPIIGLAKEFEEIYRPGRPLPLRLPEDSGALQLLQRIRDEAHRFANSYHQLLMKKRIAESVLDECPGVSDSRKQALLAKFGSVERLRKASVEDIAAVDGVSEKLAETIWRFLNR
jgi:excinuclease ABC subunit C